MAEQQSQSSLVLLCGLWRATSTSGTDYLKGKTNKDIIVQSGHSLMIFPNTRRKSDKHPEFYLYSAPPLPPRDGGFQGKSGDSPETPPHRGRGNEADPDRYKTKPPVDFEGEDTGKAEGNDDDIPF
jgi:hypothetical protein